HQHRFADTMQHRAFDVGQLVDDLAKQIPAHVGWRLELLIGARAGRAQKIAAICGLEVDADRSVRGGRRADAGPLEIALRRECGCLSHSAALGIPASSVNAIRRPRSVAASRTRISRAEWAAV